MVKVLGNGTELQIKTCQPLPRVAGPLPAHGQPRALCWRLAPRPASRGRGWTCAFENVNQFWKSVRGKSGNHCNLFAILFSLVYGFQFTVLAIIFPIKYCVVKFAVLCSLYYLLSGVSESTY